MYLVQGEIHMSFKDPERLILACSRCGEYCSVVNRVDRGVGGIISGQPNWLCCYCLPLAWKCCWCTSRRR